MRALWGQGRVGNGVDGVRVEVMEAEIVEAAMVRLFVVVDRVSVTAEGSEEGVSFVELDEDLGSDSGVDGTGFGEVRGVVVVGAQLICWRIRSGTVAGVTLSTNVKAGRRRTVVGAEAAGKSSWFCGSGMFEADSINFYSLISQQRLH